ncbi:MAG: gamma-glutamyltransferase [Pirellulales bacterium]
MSHHSTQYDRRAFLAVAGGTVAGLAATRALAMTSGNRRGLVVSQSEAAETGMEILAAGGNAVDAAVAAALVGCVVNVSKCGIAGYGGHLVIGLQDGKATAIDFNSAAPAAARADMFPVDKNGSVKGNINERGWLAAGVPGTLAGLQLAHEKYGTLPWERILQPAIRWARNGFPLPMSYPFWRDPSQPNVPRDLASARLFSRNGKPLKKGETYRNPDLADILQHLAESGSVEAFYRGEIGRRIAEAFQKNGGIVTVEDMASYKAREVTPLIIEWRGYRIATAPLTAGGLTILQAICALKALGWPRSGVSPILRDNASFRETRLRVSPSPARTQAWLEALRIAWGDRLELFGDPLHVDVPIERLLSEQYAQQSANKIKSAIADRRPVPVASDGRTVDGTLHVSAVDAGGMMVSATLTHGNSFGAQVAVEGLGLILGHGMSRFDPLPGRPNSIAPGKRPLHNMCPTIVFRDGRPVLALGATGGRRIPNAVFQVLLSFIGDGGSLEDAVAVPRLHTEGGMNIHAEPGVAEADIKHLKEIGYKIQSPLPSFVYSVEQPATKDLDSTRPLGVADHVAGDETPPGIRDPHPTISRAQ